MKESDKIMLKQLRKLTRLNDTQWLALETEVVKAGGVLKTTGTAHAELVYCADVARQLVAKHPGHANQAGHGNGGKTPKSAGNVAAGLAIEARYKESDDDYSKGGAKGAAIINRTQNMNEAKVMMTDMSRMISTQHQGVPDAKSKSFGVLAGMKETFDARFMMGMEGS